MFRLLTKSQQIWPKRYSQQPLHYLGTIKQFYLPDLGEKIKEATIKEWHIKEGDKVEEF